MCDSLWHPHGHYIDNVGELAELIGRDHIIAHEAYDEVTDSGCLCQLDMDATMAGLPYDFDNGRFPEWQPTSERPGFPSLATTEPKEAP